MSTGVSEYDAVESVGTPYFGGYTPTVSVQNQVGLSYCAGSIDNWVVRNRLVDTGPWTKYAVGATLCARDFVSGFVQYTGASAATFYLPPAAELRKLDPEPSDVSRPSAAVAGATTAPHANTQMRQLRFRCTIEAQLNTVTINTTGYTVAGTGALTCDAGETLEIELRIAIDTLASTNCYVWAKVGRNNAAAYNQTLAETLVYGNTTGANDIVVSAGQKLQWTTGATDLTIDQLTADKNIKIGYSNSITNTGPAIVIGNQNTVKGTSIAIGRLIKLDVATSNIALGFSIGGASASASCVDNIAVGINCLGGNNTITNASQCIAMGTNTLAAATTARNCQFIGYNSGANVQTSTSVVAIGTNSGATLTTGFQGVMVGQAADAAANNSSNFVAIGYNTKAASKSIVIGASSTSSTFINCLILGHDSTATKNGQFILGSTGNNIETATTVGAAGAAAALPATPTGYIVVLLNGTERKIPYYDT